MASLFIGMTPVPRGSTFRWKGDVGEVKTCNGHDCNGHSTHYYPYIKKKENQRSTLLLKDDISTLPFISVDGLTLLNRENLELIGDV